MPYITPGPSTSRTAFRSFVARAIRSPGPLGIEEREGQRLKMAEEVVPDLVLDPAARADQNQPHEIEEDPARGGEAGQPEAVAQHSAAGARLQVVDSGAQDHRDGETEAARRDGAEIADKERPPVRAASPVRGGSSSEAPRQGGNESGKRTSCDAIVPNRMREGQCRSRNTARLRRELLCGRAGLGTGSD